MSELLRRHYELYPYPRYPLLASVRRCDTYALNLEALWTRFNGCLPPASAQKILIAGCGSFSPYPFSVANPQTTITALDLSASSLRRARLHCLLHGRRNVEYKTGDLLDPATAPGPYGLIDAFGVLHHLEDPRAGLTALSARLSDGGILRVMFYSRYARQEEESIRRAFRLLKIKTPHAAQGLIRRARPGSRLQAFAQTSPEALFDAGLADALLHPSVHTYRIDELMELVAAAGLKPLLFAHAEALSDPDRELERIRRLERERLSPGNFVIFLGRDNAGPCADAPSAKLIINPCLADCIRLPQLGTLNIPGRLGHATPPLGRAERRFLRRFIHPIATEKLPDSVKPLLTSYIDSLFLLRY